MLKVEKNCGRDYNNVIWKKKNSKTKKFRKHFELNMRMKLTSSSLDNLTTELLEALWRAGSKFNIVTVYYTSQN